MHKKNQSNHQSSSYTSEDIDSVIAAVESSHHSFQHIVLLDGIVLQDEVEILPGVNEEESERTSKSPLRLAEKKGTLTKSPPSVAFSSAIGATTPLARKASR